MRAHCEKSPEQYRERETERETESDRETEKENDRQTDGQTDVRTTEKTLSLYDILKGRRKRSKRRRVEGEGGGRKMRTRE